MVNLKTRNKTRAHKKKKSTTEPTAFYVMWTQMNAKIMTVNVEKSNLVCLFSFKIILCVCFKNVIWASYCRAFVRVYLTCCSLFHSHFNSLYYRTKKTTTKKVPFIPATMKKKTTISIPTKNSFSFFFTYLIHHVTV